LGSELNFARATAQSFADPNIRPVDTAYSVVTVVGFICLANAIISHCGPSSGEHPDKPMVIAAISAVHVLNPISL